MIRTVTVPGRTLERGNGRTQVAASIKERNCNRQINKIGCDNVMADLSSFYGTVMVFLLSCGLTVSLGASRQKSFESVSVAGQHSA